jgi:hypothetical protein
VSIEFAILPASAAGSTSWKIRDLALNHFNGLRTDKSKKAARRRPIFLKCRT